MLLQITFVDGLSSSLNPNSGSSKSTPLIVNYVGMGRRVQDFQVDAFVVDLLGDGILFGPICCAISVCDHGYVLDEL